MELNYISEPELEFGQGGRNIDIRFGLWRYGPVDMELNTAPKRIRVGVVGSYESVSSLVQWLNNCQEGIAAREDTHLSNLFPAFPGFNDDVAYRSSLVLNDTLCRVIRSPLLNRLVKLEDFNIFVQQAVEAALEEIRYLAETHAPDVIICAMPESVFDRIDEQRARYGRWRESVLDFHDLLKARALHLRIPLQLIWPHTYDRSKKRKQRRSGQYQQLQDAATIAWNFHSALYYKAKGIPYRLLRNPGELDTCYVGISFYKSLDGTRMLTSLAQVFNQLGEGVIVRGGPAELSNDKQPYLKSQDAETLLTQALKTYRSEHKHLPARTVIHKTSRFQNSELEGFNAALSSQDVETADFVSLRRSPIRLYRSGDQPPLRGTYLSLDEKHHVIYTKGSVDFYKAFPGLYVPKTLGIRCDQIEQSPLFLGTEILALTKLNYNVTQFDGAEPITTRVAQKVADIVRYLPEGDLPIPLYRFYM